MEESWEDSSFSALLELTEDDAFEVLEEEDNSSAVVGKLGNRVIKVMDNDDPLTYGRLYRKTNPLEPFADSKHKKEVHERASEENREDRNYSFPEVIHSESMDVTAEDVERFSWLDERYEGQTLHVIETEFVSGEEPTNSEEIASAISDMHSDRITLRDFGEGNIKVNEDLEGNRHIYIVDLDYARFDANLKDVLWDRFVLSYTIDNVSSEDLSWSQFRDQYGISDQENQLYKIAYRIGKAALD